VGIRAHCLWVILLAGCAQGHCRKQAEPPAGQPALNVSAPINPEKPSDQDHIFVYKYDGSLQCGMGKPVTVEAMAKELHGIPLKSSSKKTDGLMHIQVCGSITGRANVFEIPVKFQKTAESRGFKKWNFE
jgi:hypothetical protein